MSCCGTSWDAAGPHGLRLQTATMPQKDKCLMQQHHSWLQAWHSPNRNTAADPTEILLLMITHDTYHSMMPVLLKFAAWPESLTATLAQKAPVHTATNTAGSPACQLQHNTPYAVTAGTMLEPA